MGRTRPIDPAAGVTASGRYPGTPERIWHALLVGLDRYVLTRDRPLSEPTG